MLQDRKVWSGERAGLVIYTNNPARLLLLWRRGSSGSLDLVFFHLVTRRCLELRELPAFQAGPFDIRSVLHSGRKLRVQMG